MSWQFKQSPHHHHTSKSPARYTPSPTLTTQDTVCWYHQCFSESAKNEMTAIMYMGGKQTSQPLMATSVTGNPNSHLFFIHNRTSKIQYLIDMGAENQYIFSNPTDKHNCTSHTFTLLAANNTTVRTYGTKLVTLNLGFQWPFKWIFTIAEVQYPIIGIDFLQYHKLLVDVHNKRLLDTLTHLTINMISSSSQDLNLFLPLIHLQWQLLLKLYFPNTLLLLITLIHHSLTGTIFNIT